MIDDLIQPTLLISLLSCRSIMDQNYDGKRKTPEVPGFSVWSIQVTHSRCLDFNLLRWLLSFGLLRQCHRKHTFLEARFDLVRFNTFR